LDFGGPVELQLQESAVGDVRIGEIASVETPIVDLATGDIEYLKIQAGTFACHLTIRGQVDFEQFPRSPVHLFSGLAATVINI